MRKKDDKANNSDKKGGIKVENGMKTNRSREKDMREREIRI